MKKRMAFASSIPIVIACLAATALSSASAPSFAEP